MVAVKTTQRRVMAIGLAALIGIAACTSGDSGGETDANAPPRPGDPVPSSPTASTPPTTRTPSATPATTPAAATAGDEPTTVVEPTPARRYDFSAIDPIVQAFIDDRGLNGAGLVVVDRDDGIVHEEYWGEFGPDRVSLIASASKMLVAGVLMRLDDDGAIDIDAPVADAVDWGDGNPAITPAQLLSNSSGLVGLGPNPVYGPYICQFLAQSTLQECAEQIFTTPDDDADVVAPDTEFRYGGAQWQVAGAAAEAVSGRSWAELLDEIYVQPCGVDSLGFNNHWTQFGLIGFSYPAGFGADPTTLRPTDNPNLEGGAYITAPDYAELLLMHLRGGRCGDAQVLSPEGVDRLHADRIGEVYGGSANGAGYGMGWWIDRSTGRLSDPGAYGATPWLDLDDGHGAYLVIEADGGSGSALAGLLHQPVADAIAAGR